MKFKKTYIALADYTDLGTLVRLRYERPYQQFYCCVTHIAYYKNIDDSFDVLAVTHATGDNFNGLSKLAKGLAYPNEFEYANAYLNNSVGYVDCDKAHFDYGSFLDAYNDGMVYLVAYSIATDIAFLSGSFESPRSYMPGSVNVKEELPFHLPPIISTYVMNDPMRVSIGEMPAPYQPIPPEGGAVENGEIFLPYQFSE